MSLSNFETFLNDLETQPLLSTSISYDNYIPIDLSIRNPELSVVDVSSSDSLQKYIWNHIKKHNAKVAFGGYLEKRNIYKRSTYFNQSNTETEERNIHLGLDLWVEAGTPIYAPMDGKIHSFKNNLNFGDYGPTIILEHMVSGESFYSLYGHLSLASLEKKIIGAEIKQGEHIATLGEAGVNGDYPPHLHFQIIKNIQNYDGDYPGVTNQQNLEFFKQNCPDPKLLLDLV